ncbi:MAG: TlpA family protein disulfide reductase [Planctomycetaceae bacterium]|jgi:hypothetical protein|nr:TlpA family protein disulfide reductase [Planctomycetaceae bacterium]
MNRFYILPVFVLSVLPLLAQEGSLRAQLEQGLKYKPIQNDVEYDSPADDEMTQCEIKITDDKRGFVITGPQKNILRKFLDTNADGQVDQWSYYHNGVEVYRDIDSNADKKADQFRWLNTAGSRWGIDLNGDKTIDLWKQISAEEVSREIVQAIITNDVQRFVRVVLGDEELKSIALGETLHTKIAQKIAVFKAPETFAAAVKASGLQQDDQWFQLNAVLPSLIPAGDWGNTNDTVVYENSVAAAGSTAGGGKPKQVSIGTLIKIADNNWRTIDVPKAFDENQPVFTFIQPAAAQNSSGQSNSETAALVNEIQELQAELPKSAAADRPAQHRMIIGKMIQIIAKASTAEERENWIRSVADVIMDSAGKNEFPQGGEQIKVLFETVNKQGNEELAAYVRSRQIMTDYYAAMNSGQDDMDAFKKYLENLEGLATDFENTEEGINGTMQLASYREMTARSPDEPLKWYAKAAQQTENKQLAEKAKGAIRRLTAAGKEVPFQANDVNGKPFDIAALKGKAVLLIFWDGSGRTAAELAAIKAVVDKADSAVPVGVNLDADAKTMQLSVTKAGLKWTQLYSPGGLDGAIGVYWGLNSLPAMILYGKDGKVIQSVQNAAELQQILEE